MGPHLSHTARKVLLLLSCVLIAIGNCGGILILRLYFIGGGKENWLAAWLQTGGWPIVLISLIVSYLYRLKAGGSNAKPILMKIEMVVASAIIGVILGLANYLYSFGLAYLPASTDSLIMSTQLVFAAIFAFLILKQKFTAYSISAVVLLTGGAAFLAVEASSDRPEGETKKLYLLGFLVTSAATICSGLSYPLIELIYRRAKHEIYYTMVMEMQLVMSLFSNFVAVIGMLATNAIKAIPMEAREFKLGEANYYVVLASIAIIWQCYFLGIVGLIFCASSLLSAVVNAVLLPFSEVLAVIFFHESFGVGKAVSLVLCLLGFAMHSCGEMKQSKSNSRMEQESQLLLHDDTERI